MIQLAVTYLSAVTLELGRVAADIVVWFSLEAVTFQMVHKPYLFFYYIIGARRLDLNRPFLHQMYA